VTTSLGARPSPSSIRMKRKGERGAPFQIPLELENVEYGETIMRMEKKEDELRDVIQPTQMGESTKVRRE
jgi:hypothetical protein